MNYKIMLFFFFLVFQVALDALFKFVSTRVLEVDIGGKLVSNMCRGAVRARPQLALKKFVPYITSRIVNLATGNFLYLLLFIYFLIISF